MFRLRKLSLPVVAALLLVTLTSTLAPPVAQANGSTGVKANIYVVTIWYQTKTSTQWHYYQQYFVTIYANGTIDYGGADTAWKNLVSWGYHPGETHKFWRSTTNG